MKLTLNMFKPWENMPEVLKTKQTIKELNAEIRISMQAESVEIQACLDLVNRILADIEDYEKRAQNFVVAKYHPIYNDAWADEEEGFPKLTESQFRENLTLTSISILDDNWIEFFYDTNDMFSTHVLIASAQDGKTFSDASMFG